MGVYVFFCCYIKKDNALIFLLHTLNIPLPGVNALSFRTGFIFAMQLSGSVLDGTKSMQRGRIMSATNLHVPGICTDRSILSGVLFDPEAKYPGANINYARQRWECGISSILPMVATRLMTTYTFLRTLKIHLLKFKKNNWLLEKHIFNYTLS